MYVCPNCGGNLKFRIPCRKMFCEYCKTHIDPHEAIEHKDAEEHKEGKITCFTCPQCGGELISMDHEATAHCSYCGASNVLKSRLSTYQLPDYIIPFKITKDECKKIYYNFIRKCFFVPKEYKNPDCIDKFRPIYMPYWMYHIVQQGEAKLDSKLCKFSYVEEYDLFSDINIHYKWLVYDASSIFYDNKSDMIRPYDLNTLEQFNSSFLSGFYAETSDIPSDVYQEEAIFYTSQETYLKIFKQKELRNYDNKEMESIPLTELKNSLHTKCIDCSQVMLPVWFLSYKNKNRVAYTTINGQSGKVYMDLPIDIMKYIIGSLFMTIPIAILLNLFLSIRCTNLLTIAIILSYICIWIYKCQLEKQYKNELHENDIGIWSKLYRKTKKRPPKKYRNITIDKTDPVEGEFIWNIFCFLCIAILAIFEICVAIETRKSMLESASAVRCDGILLLITGLILLFKYYHKIKKISIIALQKMKYAIHYAIIPSFISCIILIFNPVDDMYYYIGTILCAIGMIAILIAVLHLYNLIASAEIPQFCGKVGRYHD